MINCLFTISGRAGSKGNKNKNIKQFLGYPLPLFSLAVIELYLDSRDNIQADIAVNTDSSILIEILQKGKYPVHPVHRREELAGNRVAKKDVIIDTLIEMELKTGKSYDLVVDLDITAPLRTVADLEKLIDIKLATKGDVVFFAVSSMRNPYFNMVRQSEAGYEKAEKSNYVTRQEAPKLYDMNASLYAYSSTHLKAGKGVLEGYNEMYDTGILDLDYENDFELMEVIAQHLFENNIDLKKIYQYMENAYGKHQVNMKDIVIVGAKGCAKEILFLLEENNKVKKEWNILGFIDDSNDDIHGYSILGDDQWILTYNKPLNVVCAIGDPSTRKKIIQSYQSNPNLIFPTIVSQHALVGDYVALGAGTIVCAGVTITTDVELGEYTIVNLGSTLCHESKLGDFITIAPGVNVSGGVVIGQETNIGVGAKVIQNITIGKQVMVGAGAVVITDLPDGCTAVGVPAKINPKK